MMWVVAALSSHDQSNRPRRDRRRSVFYQHAADNGRVHDRRALDGHDVGDHHLVDNNRPGGEACPSAGHSPCWSRRLTGPG